MVLKTYGSGNVPTVPRGFLNDVRKATANGQIIVNVTQCARGHVEQGLYDTSAVLTDCVVSLVDKK